ncbi:probable protein phosphatase 2C 21 [Anoplophora glabripennis]|uniref:probable protein phosphatase 2C 21 n=1 Tax=Anoplophora glabripennis TaxID=217634 RepID=UPI000874987B|nr:probable protein phosphatase 2C 21 [Anoplophora glabripennis]
MGSYLSTPVTKKFSSDEVNDKLKCGSSSMQGWRVTQEDAHNCILGFDANTSFFAVYDGHGGHEVAQYCSENLPQFVKDTQAYKDGDITKALIEGFLGFDATIATKKVVDVLKKIAGDKEATEGSDDEENVDNLYEEAAMPIEQVIEKYTNLVNPAHKALKKADSDKFPKSPFLKAKKEGESSVASSSSEADDSKVNSSEGCASSTDEVSSSSNYLNEAKTALDVEDQPEKHSETNGSVPEGKVTSSDSPDCKEAAVAPSNADSELKKEEIPVSSQNGEVSESDSKDDVTSSSVSQENGEVTSKGKGKALAKTKVSKTPVNVRPKRNAKQLYKTLLDFGEDSEDTEDEEDKNFEGPNVDGSSDDDDEDGVNAAIEVEGSEESSAEEEGDEEEDEEDIDDEDEEDLEFGNNMKEEPGSDSGCTAVVALLRGNELYVANAGDSRCIVCRNGKAVEMSFDHKPEDEPERARIVKAGGKVTTDGRVNGGLNLSRAIGDHAYKQNKEMSDREQMITALPDVKSLTINPGEDEFMVLACDGIWNFMSSQEVVDFVKPRIAACEDLSHICEEMFDHCLAPDTMGDGTGCDNMTAIIVQFKSNILKRSAAPEPGESDPKRAKTEENESQIDTTA